MKKFHYWRGRLVGFWQYQIKPRLNIHYVHGFIVGAWEEFWNG